MKKINIFISGLLVFTSMAGLTSCSDFLANQPTSSMPEDSVFAKIDNVEPLVLGLYKSYRDCRAGRDGEMPELGTDETKQGHFQLLSEATQSGLDLYNGQLNPDNPQVNSMWNKRWPAITSAAKAIYALGKTQDNPQLAAQLMGEACFIHGLLMYELSMYWGEIPVVDIAKQDSLGNGRQPLKTVWEYIINDFTIAANNMSPEHYNGDPQRATQGAALTMLAKAYMSAPEETGMRDFAKADAALKKVIDSGLYQLQANYADLYRYDNPNTTESLFELQFTTAWPDYNMWEFDCGSRAVQAWFGDGCMFSGYDFLVPTSFCWSTVADGGLWEDGDLRKDVAIRYDFTYNTDRILQDGSAGTPGVFHDIVPDLSKTTWTGTTDELGPHIKKFEDPRTDWNSGLGINNMYNSGKNLTVLRYADVLLLHAECLNELGQTAEAVDLVNNTVRKRAWGGTLPESATWSTGMSQSDFRKNIMDERMRELCFEGWRRSDLIRTDMFVNLIKTRNEWAAGKGTTPNTAPTIQEFNKLYPIPLFEINGDNHLTQNPGYTN